MGEIYKEYQVTDGDIRFKVCVTAMKWCDAQFQHLAKKREAIKNIPDKINGQTVSSKDELLKLQQYRQSLLEEVDKEELQIECLRIPAETGCNTPLDTFREYLKEPLLTGVSTLLMASQGSEALIHSSEYERAASEPTQKIWAGEFIKQHSENAYFGLHGSDTEKIKAYTILLKTNEWLRDAQLKPYQPKQTAAPAGDQEARQDSIPGGFVGFCYSKICELPETTRTAFLATNKGDSSFYCFRDRWKADFVKPVKNPEQGISKAKALYRKLNKN